MKFLGRARKFLKELASEPEGKVQYFNVTCVSGHRLRGERTEGYQALRCPACGEGVFVLPRSPLPEPAAPAPARSSPARTARRDSGWVNEGPIELTDQVQVTHDLGDDAPGAAGDEIIGDDLPGQSRRGRGRNRAREGAADAAVAPGEKGEPFWEEDFNRAASGHGRDAPQGERGPPVAPDRPAAGGTQSARQRRPAAAGAAHSGQPRNPPAVLEIRARPSRRMPSRLTLVLVLVPLLVVAAFAWNYRRIRLREAPLIAEKGRIEGIPALEEGDFDKAYQLLSDAKRAVDSLGGAVDGADEIRTAAEEAAIFVDLSPKNLEEMLEEAGRTDPQDWPSKFDTLYKGHAILIDATVTEEPGAGTSSSYLVDYVILPPGGGNRFNDATGSAPDRFGLIDFTGFQLFELARPRKGTRVAFGARLASFQFDAANEVWWVGLEPRSGVFITHTKALEAVGWPRGAEAGLPPRDQP